MRCYCFVGVTIHIISLPLADYYFSAKSKYSDDENASNVGATNVKSSSSPTNSQSKRLRGKCATTTSQAAIASTSGTSKRKVLLHRNSSLTSAVCDIRMIDFAHTTFLRKNADATLPTYINSPTVQHQGPDNGFLRGIESLRRLLTEILTDQEVLDK